MNKFIIGGIVSFIFLVVYIWPKSSYPITNKVYANENIIAFGDSWTQGVGASDDKDYPSFLSKKLNKEVINAGVSGNTTAQALKRLEVDVLDQEPGIVILLLGGNDIRKRIKLEKTLANLKKIINRIQGEGAMVVLVGFKLPLFGHYHSAYHELAEEKGCVFVDNILSGMLLDDSLMSDRVHPNGKGYEIYAARIHGVLKEYLK